MSGVSKYSGYGSVGKSGNAPSSTCTSRPIFFWALLILLPLALALLLLLSSGFLDPAQDPHLPSGASYHHHHSSLPATEAASDSTDTCDSRPWSSSSDEGDGTDVDNRRSPNFTGLVCDIFQGEWIRDDAEPLYTNATCMFIQDHQNCMRNGRPDKGYLYWRWKPFGCDLPRFESLEFLKFVKGKALAFVGDSIARNHFHSLLCSISQAESPRNLFRSSDDKNVVWFFPSYNFTLAVLWSPFLVWETEEEANNISSGISKLYLDVANRNWASNVSKYDYMVVSSGQWFMKPAVYLVGNEVVGCYYCPELNLTEKGFYFAFERALRTTFEHFTHLNFKGTVFFRTFTPDHFENGRWDSGGKCSWTDPFRNGTISLEGIPKEMYRIQLQEYNKAKKVLGGGMKLLDTIHASLLRPDGHPGAYRILQPFSVEKNGQVQNDCLHWCLPGPIDTWNQMLMELLKHL